MPLESKSGIKSFRAELPIDFMRCLRVVFSASGAEDRSTALHIRALIVPSSNLTRLLLPAEFARTRRGWGVSVAMLAASLSDRNTRKIEMGFMSNGGWLALTSAVLCVCQWMMVLTVRDLGRLSRDLREISKESCRSSPVADPSE